jgi:hypothetical protein
MGTFWESHTLFLAPGGVGGDDSSTAFDGDREGWTILRTLVDVAGSSISIQEDTLLYQAIAPTRWAVLEYGSELNPLPHFEALPDDGQGIHFLAQGQIAWHATYSHRLTGITGPASIDLSGNLTYDLTGHTANIRSMSGEDTADSQAERRMLGGASGLVLIENHSSSPSPPGEWTNGDSSIWATVRVLFKTSS